MDGPEEIDEVLPGLFIGNYATACSAGVLELVGITHILTAAEGLEPAFPDVQSTQRFTYKLVPLLDTLDCDAKSLFPECYECQIFRFIETAIGAGGKVLVHCMYGISRSATLVCAYLMQKQEIGYRQAIRTLKAAHRQTDPSEAFIEQLKAYEVELTTPVLQYSCRMCRTQLFCSKDFETHSSVKPKRFDKRAPQREPQTICSSFFLNAASWMGDLSEPEGKLYCPKCGCKLGEYNWSGKQCSCGRFVTPGFQIAHSK